MTFAKELNLILPNSIRINRGGHVIHDVVQIARSHGFSDLVIVHENRGKPNCLVICHIPHGPTSYFELLNVITRHDLGTKKELGKISNQHPHLIFDGFCSAIEIRIKNILYHLFPAAKERSKRTLAFVNRSDRIIFRHHIYHLTRPSNTLQLSEVGPRYDLKLYQIKLGSIASNSGDLEWVARSHLHARKNLHE